MATGYESTEQNTLWTENNLIRSVTGVTKFHNSGYYGERVKAATGEDWDIRNYNPENLVEIPFGNGSGWGNFSGGHGTKTAATFFQVAPKSRLYQMPKIFSHQLSSDPSRFKCGFITDCYPIIKQEGITSIFCSFDMITDKYHDEELTKALDELKTFTLILSAGNNYSSDYNELMECEAVFGIGACYISGLSPKPESFSSTYSGVDFCAPDRQTVKFAKEIGVIEYGKESGTSFSAPWFQGMCCLVNDFAIDKAGKPLEYKDMYRFMQDHCVDVGDEGVDDKCGHGMPVLPDPSEIKLEDYIPSSVDTPLTPPSTDQDSDKEESEVSKQPEQTKENYKLYETVSVADEFNFDKDVCQLTIIPYQSIKEVGFAQCEQPKETVMSWYSRQDDKPQIVTNGGLFNMSTGTNILSFVDEGKEQNYQADFEGIGTEYSNLAALIPGTDSDHDWKDFMSAYPVLVREGKALTKFDKGSELNYYAARTAIGVTKSGDVIILTADKSGATGGMLFSQMAKVFEEHGAWYAINLDGGGSVYKMEFGKVTNNPTENRLIDNVFYVKLKEANDMSENPTANLDPIVVEPGDYYAHEPIDLKAGVDQSEDSPSKALDVIKTGEKFTINSTLEWLGVTWAVTSYNYEMGFIACTGTNFDSIPPLPAIFFTDDGEAVIVDRYESSDDGEFYHVAFKAVDSDGMYSVGEKVDTMLTANSLEYSMYYDGTLVDESTDSDEDTNITPGEGSGEGDPEEPDFGDFPAKYQVNPSMVNTVLNVRSAPINGAVVTTLKPGTVVTVLKLESNGEWAQIEYDDAGSIGYCAVAYLIYYSEDPGADTEEPEDNKDDETVDTSEPEVTEPNYSDDIYEIKDTLMDKSVVVVAEAAEDFVASGSVVNSDRVTKNVGVNVSAGEKFIITDWIADQYGMYFFAFNTGIKSGETLPQVESTFVIKATDPVKFVDSIQKVPGNIESTISGAHVVKLADIVEYLIPSYGEYENIIDKPCIPIVSKYGVLIDVKADDSESSKKYFYDGNDMFKVSSRDYKVVGQLYGADKEESDSSDKDETPSYEGQQYPWLDATADKDDVDERYKEAVNFAICTELMPLDKDGKFNPKANVTREELAHIIAMICSNDSDDTVESPIA